MTGGWTGHVQRDRRLIFTHFKQKLMASNLHVYINRRCHKKEENRRQMSHHELTFQTAQRGQTRAMPPR